MVTVDPRFDRRRQLALSLMQRGANTQPPQQGNMHWSQNIAGALNTLAGAMAYRKNEAAEQAYQQSAKDTIASALNPDPVQVGEAHGPTQTPKTSRYDHLVSTLAGNPATSDTALNFQLQNELAKAKVLNTPTSRERNAGAYGALDDEGKKNWAAANSSASSGYLKVGDAFLNPVTGERIEINLAPGDTPEHKGDIKGSEDFAKNKESFLASEPKFVGKIGSLKSKQEVLASTISDAKALLNDWTTSFGASLKNLPTTQAKQLDNLLETVRANVAFSALQDMRDNSPTGGALGQVSERELALLAATMGSLDQAGDMDALAKVLDRIAAQQSGAIERIQYVYDQEKSRYGSRIIEQEKPKNERSLDDLLEQY